MIAFWIATQPSRVVAETVIPNFWDQGERFIKPDTSKIRRLRFLTTTDFPPFNFVDSEKRLSGFHIDLARAICRELDVAQVCQIQALPWASLQSTLEKGDGEAILAGLAVTAQSRQQFSFTRPYFRLPARFVAHKSSPLSEPMAMSLKGETIGVIDGTRHAAFLKAYFGKSSIRVFLKQEAALEALEKKQIKAYFGDGLRLATWLHTNAKNACCGFSGGPYFSETFFGLGMSIATRKDDDELAEAMNYALRAINDKGIFSELYLRYFPIGLY